MARKDDLIEEAQSLGIELDASETIADLEAKIAVHHAQGNDGGDGSSDESAAVSGGEVKRRRLNRGSRRRLERTLSRLNIEIDQAIKELDLQAFVADDDGNRVAEWPLVSEMREFRAHVNERITAQINS